MSKKAIHLYRSHGDHRNAGQTHHEFTHSTACGFVRDVVTNKQTDVSCKLCLREMRK